MDFQLQRAMAKTVIEWENEKSDDEGSQITSTSSEYSQPILCFDAYGNLTSQSSSAQCDHVSAELPSYTNLINNSIGLHDLSSENLSNAHKLSRSYNKSIGRKKKKNGSLSMTETELKQVIKEDFQETATISRYGRERKKRTSDGFLFGTINFNELRRVTGVPNKKDKSDDSLNGSFDEGQCQPSDERTSPNISIVREPLVSPAHRTPKTKRGRKPSLPLSENTCQNYDQVSQHKRKRADTESEDESFTTNNMDEVVSCHKPPAKNQKINEDVAVPVKRKRGRPRKYNNNDCEVIKKMKENDLKTNKVSTPDRENERFSSPKTVNKSNASDDDFVVNFTPRKKKSDRCYSYPCIDLSSDYTTIPIKGSKPKVNKCDKIQESALKDENMETEYINSDDKHDMAASNSEKAVTSENASEKNTPIKEEFEGNSKESNLKDKQRLFTICRRRSQAMASEVAEGTSSVSEDHIMDCASITTDAELLSNKRLCPMSHCSSTRRIKPDTEDVSLNAEDLSGENPIKAEDVIEADDVNKVPRSQDSTLDESFCQASEGLQVSKRGRVIRKLEILDISVVNQMQQEARKLKMFAETAHKKLQSCSCFSSNRVVKSLKRSPRRKFRHPKLACEDDVESFAGNNGSNRAVIGTRSQSNDIVPQNTSSLHPFPSTATSNNNLFSDQGLNLEQLNKNAELLIRNYSLPNGVDSFTPSSYLEKIEGIEKALHQYVLEIHRFRFSKSVSFKDCPERSNLECGKERCDEIAKITDDFSCRLMQDRHCGLDVGALCVDFKCNTCLKFLYQLLLRFAFRSYFYLHIADDLFDAEMWTHRITALVTLSTHEEDEELADLEVEYPQRYFEGNLVWVALKGYPLWPAVVVPHVETNSCTKFDGRHGCRFRVYFVHFLNDNNREHWMRHEHVLAFEGSVAMLRRLQVLTTVEESERDSDDDGAETAFTELMLRSLPALARYCEADGEIDEQGALKFNEKILTKWHPALREADAMLAKNDVERVGLYSKALRCKALKPASPAASCKVHNKRKTLSPSKLVKINEEGVRSESCSTSRSSSSAGDFTGFRDRCISKFFKKNFTKGSNKNWRDQAFRSYSKSCSVLQRKKHPDLTDGEIDAIVAQRWRKLPLEQKRSFLGIKSEEVSSEDAKLCEDSDEVSEASSSSAASSGRLSKLSGGTLPRGTYRLPRNEKVCMKCEGVALESNGSDVFRCKGTCCGFYHFSCCAMRKQDNKEIRCPDCESDTHVCFICKEGAAACSGVKTDACENKGKVEGSACPDKPGSKMSRDKPGDKACQDKREGKASQGNMLEGKVCQNRLEDKSCQDRIDDKECLEKPEVKSCQNNPEYKPHLDNPELTEQGMLKCSESDVTKSESEVDKVFASGSSNKCSKKGKKCTERKSSQMSRRSSRFSSCSTNTILSDTESERISALQAADAVECIKEELVAEEQKPAASEESQSEQLPTVIQTEPCDSEAAVSDFETQSIPPSRDTCDKTFLQRCSVASCGKFYHLSCVLMWPQVSHNWHENKKLVCPRHVCHTCCSEDMGNTTAKIGSMTRCLRCPATYHAGQDCIAAGSEEVSTGFHVCPQHAPQAKVNHINVNWCFGCSKGGSLILCDECPAAYHEECLDEPLSPSASGFVCGDCISGKQPAYGDIVWTKLGAYRWWPGQVLHPRFIPDNIENLKHTPGMFCVHFFGSHDYYWVHRGRVFHYQEGDRGVKTYQKSNLNKQFELALEETKAAFDEQRTNRALREAKRHEKTSNKPPPFVKIDTNKPVGNVKRQELELPPKCDCDPFGEAPCGPNGNCINRMLMIECASDACHAAERCCNQRFQRRQYPALAPAKVDGRGWGLIAQEDIRVGEFVIEYVGELVDEAEMLRRIDYMHQINEENYYFLTITKDIIIDAGPKGNFARFMNHSCDPNCETQKWQVGTETRVGLFAITDIPKGCEVTFNYHFECVGTEKKACRCGTKSCTGFIGAKKQKTEHIKKSLLNGGKRKYKKKKNAALKPTEDDCFRCGQPGDLVLCDAWQCPKGYHLSCLGLDTLPRGKWICPWHHCDDCGAKSVSRCDLCPNSFCRNHDQGTLVTLPLVGDEASLHYCLDHTHEYIRHYLKENNLMLKELLLPASNLAVSRLNRVKGEGQETPSSVERTKRAEARCIRREMSGKDDDENDWDARDRSESNGYSEGEEDDDDGLTIGEKLRLLSYSDSEESEKGAENVASVFSVVVKPRAGRRSCEKSVEDADEDMKLLRGPDECLREVRHSKLMSPATKKRCIQSRIDDFYGKTPLKSVNNVAKSNVSLYSPNNPSLPMKYSFTKKTKANSKPSFSDNLDSDLDLVYRTFVNTTPVVALSNKTETSSSSKPAPRPRGRPRKYPLNAEKKTSMGTSWPSCSSSSELSNRKEPVNGVAEQLSASSSQLAASDIDEVFVASDVSHSQTPPRRGRGRPRKIPGSAPPAPSTGRKRGRPRKCESWSNGLDLLHEASDSPVPTITIEL